MFKLHPGTVRYVIFPSDCFGTFLKTVIGNDCKYYPSVSIIENCFEKLVLALFL